jgi:chorismate dehydratase
LLQVRRSLPNVRFVRGLEPSQADAILQIGDTAMRTRNRPPEGFVHTLDLGADWLEWTGLPFVYAAWVVRSALDPALKTELRAFLEASLAAGLASLPEIARRETGPGWSAAEVEGYLRRFHYRFGPEELQGLARFESLLTEHGLLASD